MAETALPEIPDGFRLMGSPAVPQDQDLPAIPEGFKLIQGGRAEQPRDLPPIPEGFKLVGAPIEAAKPVEESFVDKIGQPVIDPNQAEAMAAAQGAGVLDSALNVAKGIGEQTVDLFGQFGNLLAATAPGPESGIRYPYGSGDVQADLQKASKEMRDFDLGYDQGTTWEQVKAEPTARNILGFAVEQGLVSTPDMMAAIFNLPGYVAARTGGLAEDRAVNEGLDHARPEDVLKVLPAATASALLDRWGGRSMMGLNEAVTQGVTQIPKEIAKSALKEGGTEAAQEGIEDVATTAGTKEGWKPADTAERMLAGALTGGITGGIVRAGTSTAEAVSPKEAPVEGQKSETVETADFLPSETPVTQDDGAEVDSPLASASSSITPEERALLRRTALPDEDVDLLSYEERAAKVAEARAAGVRVNQAMIKAAERYQPAKTEAEPVAEALPAAVEESQPETVTEQPVEPVETEKPVEAADAAESNIPAPVTLSEPSLAPEVEQDLAASVRESVDEDIDQQAEQAIAPVRPALAATVDQSVSEDIKGDGTRFAPVYAAQPQHVEVAAQQVNTEPTEAQKLAGNYKHGHLKIDGLDIAIETPKGAIRSGTSPAGDKWQVEMPAHYGRIKKTTGADGEQVDVYIGDDLKSPKVFVVDQKDLGTGKFDEHKAILGARTKMQAKRIYEAGFSDGKAAERIAGITPMNIADFKLWLKEGNTTRPLAGSADAKRFINVTEPLYDSGRKELAEVVRRVAGIYPTYEDRIDLEAAPAWGVDGPQRATGSYDLIDDVITLANDSANRKAAYHEAFHRVQNKLLNAKERKVLAAETERLREIVRTDKKRASVVDKMTPIELEAEAFAIWANHEDTKPREPLKLHIAVRKLWNKIREITRRAKNFVRRRGFKTSETVFKEARKGEIAKREPKNAEPTERKQYAIVDDRATPEERPAKPKTSVPTIPKPKTRFADRVAAVSKAMAAKAKSKGGKFDRLTEDDGETFADYSTRKVLDYLDPVLKMQEKVGANVEEHADAYLTARLAEGTIRHELHQVDEKYVQPAIKELAAVGATEKDLHEYLYAMHAPERNRVVGLRNEEGSDLYKAATDPTVRGASGMSTNEAKDMLRELAKDREKFMGIRRAASHIRAMLDDGLKRQLRAGLINKATYDELTQQWQHYVPLRAESDQDGTGGGMPSKSRGFDVRGDEFKGATGRYTKADNVVAYAVNNSEQSIIRAEKNKAATAALRFINQFDPEGESIAKVYWSEDPDKLGDITKAPPVYKRVIGKDGKVTSRAVNAFQMKDDVLAAKVGGKTYYMQFADPKVGLALKKMTFGELGATMRMLKTVSNWQSLINTRANPAFIPINFLRDVQTGATIAMSKDFKAGEIAKMVGSIPKAMGALLRDARGKAGQGSWIVSKAQADKWDKIVADFKANGGKISFDQYNSIEDTAKKIQKDLAKAGSRGVAGKTWRGFIDLIENLNDTIENGMRVAVYNAAVEQGKTPKRAAFLARDLTVDFQKKGELTPHLNALYTFFNASVQGNTNFAKALYKSRKVKVAMGALIMAGYAQHIINSALAGDDDDGENAYKKMLRNEPWTFERNIVLFLPGSKEYIKLPLGFGMNAFWHLGAQAGAVTTGDKGFLDSTLDSTRVAFDAFNPLGSGGWVSMALPSVIDPVWELGTNQNFSGNPIYPKENQYDPAPPPKSEQAFSSTHPAFRWGAETLNKISGGSDKLPGAVDVYPDSLEYLWGWFTGGVGRFASQTVETAQRGVDLDFEPKKTPFIRSFYGAVDDQGKRSEYFAQREKVEYVKGKVKEFKEAGDEEGLKDFMADNQQDYDAIKAFEVAEKQRRRINKLRRKNEKREGAEKDLKALDEQELDIMNQARKSYFEAKPE